VTHRKCTRVDFLVVLRCARQIAGMALLAQ
jgi:hypothetical protein